MERNSRRLSSLSEILQNGEQVRIHVIVIHQAHQVIAALYLKQMQNYLSHTISKYLSTETKLNRQLHQPTSSSNFRDRSPSGYKEAHPLNQISNASSFHTWKLAGSTTVGWMISLAGKTPHVTAFTSFWVMLDTQMPSLFTAM